MLPQTRLRVLALGGYRPQNGAYGNSTSGRLVAVHPNDFVGGDRPVQALQCVLAKTDRFDLCLERREHMLTDQNPSRSSLAARATGEIWDRADHRIILPALEADLP